MGDTTTLLKEQTLFAGLPDEVIAELASHFEPLRLAPGEVLFEKGERSDAMYIIQGGEVKVYLGDESGQEQILSQLGPGQSIGQMSILDGEPRTASVAALTPTELLKLPREHFLDVIGRQPPSLMEQLRAISDQLRVGYLDILKALPLLRQLPEDALSELATKLEPVALEQDQFLFRKGDAGNSLYIIDTGWVKIVTEDEQGEELVLNKCGPGQAIGEMSLIDLEPRSASVVATTPAVGLLKLGREDFLEVLTAHPEVSLSVMNYLSGRMRFATTYIEQAIEWSKRIGEGDYDFAMHEIETEQSSVNSDDLSDEARASELLTAFFTMVKGVQEREQALKTQLQRLTIEIDEAKVQEDFERLTSSDFFTQLKASAQQMREQAAQE